VFDIAAFIEALLKRIHHRRGRIIALDEPNYRHSVLLRASIDRPCHRGAAKNTEKFSS
jgi:hypothetical protein